MCGLTLTGISPSYIRDDGSLCVYDVLTVRCEKQQL